jgi:hypothetical protein
VGNAVAVLQSDVTSLPSCCGCKRSLGMDVGGTDPAMSLVVTRKRDRRRLVMEVLFCIYNKLMYNVGRLNAAGQLTTCWQQARKMPLVTAILPDLSYAWGRRCGLDYVLFSTIGQISPRHHRHHDCGEGRWLCKKPNVIYNLAARQTTAQATVYRLLTALRFHLPGSFQARLVVIYLLPTGSEWVWRPALANNEESQVLAYLAFNKFLSLTAYFAIWWVLTHPLAQSPSCGEGVNVPPGSFIYWLEHSTGRRNCQKIDKQQDMWAGKWLLERKRLTNKGAGLGNQPVVPTRWSRESAR